MASAEAKATTPMWVICRHSNRAMRGFSLLEMVVVLALMALAAGLAGPSAYRTFERWQRAERVDRVRGELAALPIVARQAGRDLWIGTEDGETLASLPQDAELTFDAPWRVRANGACDDAQGLLRIGSLDWRIGIAAPFCRVRIDPA